MGILERVFPSTLIFTILLYKGGVRMSLFSNNKFMVLENSDSQKSELFGVESMSSGHASDAETYSFTNESFDFVVEYTREYINNNIVSIKLEFTVMFNSFLLRNS